MASGSLQCKTLVLKVSIHCEGCKKKVKKVLQSVEAVYKCDVDVQSNKVTVAVTGRVGADALIKKLRRSGKHAEEWPEEQKLQEQQPTDALIPGETKNQTTEPNKPVAPIGKPESGDSDANGTSVAALSSADAPVESKKIAGGTVKPTQECGQSNTAVADGDANADGSHGGATVGPNEAKRKRKQQPEEGKPADAVATAAAQGHAGGDLILSPLPLQRPAHVVTSYSMAQPSASASYYSAAGVAGAMPPPSQEYSYASYSAYFSYDHGTPGRDSYYDLFSDDNANSCTVM